MSRRRRCNAYYSVRTSWLPFSHDRHYRCYLREGHDADDAQSLHHGERTTGTVTEHRTWRVHSYDYTIPIERRAPGMAWPFGDPLG